MSSTESDLFRLRHMLDAAVSARDFAGDTKSVFEGSKLRQYATVRALTILGEAAKVVSTGTRARCPGFPWREMAGMRDVLVHDYFGTLRALHFTPPPVPSLRSAPHSLEPLSG